MTSRVAFLGLGGMGSGMAKNLSLRGNLSTPIVVWNRTVARAEALRTRLDDCKIADSVADAVTNSDIIFSCLADDEAALKVFNDALSVDVAGKLFVSCETITPGTSEKLASMVGSKGAGFVSMPG
jgi:3-hydroxyisobutyrate dehydrogenase-like beta-hydroxyacid dehydrogenase